MRPLLLVLFSSVLIIFHIAVVHSFSIRMVSVMPLVLFAVYWAAKRGIQDSLAIVLSAVVLDTFSVLPFGVYTLSFVVLLFVVTVVARRFVREMRIIHYVGLVGGSVVVFLLFVALFSWLLSFLGLSLYSMAYPMLPVSRVIQTVVFHLVVAVPLFWVFASFDRLVAMYESHQFGTIRTL
jgi:hypothetical protein